MPPCLTRRRLLRSVGAGAVGTGWLTGTAGATGAGTEEFGNGASGSPPAVAGLYLAFLLETLVSVGLNRWRFRTGPWKAVSRVYRSSSETEPG